MMERASTTPWRDGRLVRAVSLAVALWATPLCRGVAFAAGPALCWRVGVPLLLHALADWQRKAPGPPFALGPNGLARPRAAILAGIVATYARGCRCLGTDAMGALAAMTICAAMAAFWGYGAALGLGAIPAPPSTLPITIAPAPAGVTMEAGYVFLAFAALSAADALVVAYWVYAAWPEWREGLR